MEQLTKEWIKVAEDTWELCLSEGKLIRYESEKGIALAFIPRPTGYDYRKP